MCETDNREVCCLRCKPWFGVANFGQQGRFFKCVNHALKQKLCLGKLLRSYGIP